MNNQTSMNVIHYLMWPRSDWLNTRIIILVHWFQIREAADHSKNKLKSWFWDTIKQAPTFVISTVPNCNGQSPSGLCSICYHGVADKSTASFSARVQFPPPAEIRGRSGKPQHWNRSLWQTDSMTLLWGQILKEIKMSEVPALHFVLSNRPWQGNPNGQLWNGWLNDRLAD